MDASSSLTTTPRINGALLARYVNQPVRLVGRVVDQQQLNVTVESSDAQRILVKRTPQTAQVYSSNTYVEVMGNVLPDHTIQEIAVAGFGPVFDMGNYEQLVKFMHTPQLRDIFGVNV